MIGQNKKTNGLALIVLAALIFTGNLFAQPQQRRQGPPPLPDSTQIKKMVDEMAEKLSLKDEQKSEILNLHLEHFAEAENLMAEHKKEHEIHRETMDALRQDFEKQVKALLTDEQKTEFEKFVKNRGPKRDQPRPRRKQPKH